MAKSEEVVHYGGLDSTVIDVALAENLDTEGLLKLKAVEYAIAWSKGRTVSIEQFDAIYTNFYNKIKENNGKQE